MHLDDTKLDSACFATGSLCLGHLTVHAAHWQSVLEA